MWGDLGTLFSISAQIKKLANRSFARSARYNTWRGLRDLNSRAGFPTYSLSRGAPSPLGYFSVFWRRGRDSNSWYAFNVHTISNRAPSTNSDTSPCREDLLFIGRTFGFGKQKIALFAKKIFFSKNLAVISACYHRCFSSPSSAGDGHSCPLTGRDDEKASRPCPWTGPRQGR